MREVVHRIDAPPVAGAMVVRVPDPIEHRVAHVDVRRRHVDLRPEHERAVGELPRPHAREQIEVLVDRASTIGALAAGFRQGAAVAADVVARLAVDVGLALPDQVDRILVELFEIVGREVQRVPSEAEPADVVFDRVDVLDVLLRRVGVVEPEVAGAAEVARDAEIETDGLGVADVEITVRLGRKARDDTAAVAALGLVLGDDRADEIEQVLIIVTR